MKKISFILLLIFVSVMSVNASASYSLTVSKSTIEKGQSVTATLTVKNTAAWNVKITSSGSTNGCSNSWADATSNGQNGTKSFSVTCKGSDVGTISFRASGDITSSDGANSSVSKTVSVTVKQPREKSKNNNLKNITVEGYELVPAFDKDTLEYNVSVPSTVEKVTINATKADNYESVTGTGEFDVIDGINPFEIVVTSETGVQKTYLVSVTVEDVNPINVTTEENETKILLKTLRSIEMPANYVENSISIEGITIPTYYNEKNDITLVGLKGDTSDLYVYKDGKYSKYVELTSNNTQLMVKDINELNGYIKRVVSIQDMNINCMSVLKTSRFVLIKGLNIIDGVESIYVYDTKDNNIMLYDDELISSLQEDNQNYFYIILSLGGILFLCLILLIILSCSVRKKNKLIRNFLEKHNQTVEQPSKPKKEKTKNEKKVKEVKEEKTTKEETNNVIQEIVEEEYDEKNNFLNEDKKSKKKQKKEKELPPEIIDEDEEYSDETAKISLEEVLAEAKKKNKK